MKQKGKRKEDREGRRVIVRKYKSYVYYIIVVFVFFAKYVFIEQKVI